MRQLSQLPANIKNAMEGIVISVEAISNKEKIFFTATRLFSQKGYSNVSMREIAKEVGIKAASIYNHYSSKEALLDAIADYFKEQLTKDVYTAFVITDDTDARSFIENTLKVNNRFFEDSVFLEIARIILREQFQNPKIRTLLLEQLIQKPRDTFAGYFGKLMELGKMRSINPMLVAMEYHAFFIYRFYESSLAMDSENPDFIVNEDEQKEHIELFLDNYCL